jgi:hypothetical protein
MSRALNDVLAKERAISRNELKVEVEKLLAVTTEMQCTLDVIKGMNRSGQAKVFDLDRSLRDRTIN